MSRPNQGQGRPLGASKPKSKALSNAVPSNAARRSAGTVPGLARAASQLRQLGSSPGHSSSLASIPAHLRNLSAPRIPSPLGKGTPARNIKLSLPARTSKTTEKHVFLPEDPQLAPLPRTASDINLSLARSGRPRSYSGGSAGGPPSSSLRASQSYTTPLGQDERSDAEKMTKREREENSLPRLTAYSTADGYRLRLLQAFLKREHGVGVVRVFDDCIYAVYNLPLLPGYGAATRIRSSPAVKSPGGVSALERMTQAEDLGYNDEYFPVQDEDAPDGEDYRAPHDPSEYILSHSPPTQSQILEPGMEDTFERAEEHTNEEHPHHPEDHDGPIIVDHGDGPHFDREGPQLLEQQEELEEQHREEQQREQEVEAEQHHTRHVHVPGTHMSSTHPGYLEHVPSSALTPSELEDPRGEQQAVSRSQRKRYPSPPRRRRKSYSSQNVAEAVFFSYGVSVFFGFTAGEERTIMSDCEAAGAWQHGQAEDDWEVEEFHYVYDSDAESPRIYNDMFTFKSRSHLFKLSLAHAIAQSTKLSFYESVMQESLALTSSFPKELAVTGHLQMNRIDALKMTGRLFRLRMDVNLIGGILDTPELFWSEASLNPLYEAIYQYLEIGPRVQVLNDRLSVVGDLLEIIHEYIDQRAMHRITWIIIWLILIACIVQVGEVVARLVFHGIEAGAVKSLFVVRATRAALGVA
ncbi:Sad1-interacting factor 3 [Vanrija albida]|uniref:Sad1-interacting factor 3 n=1 Tax=Vanrija albida TaxID=181172 RepID=A0ABR3PV50_9TREE